MKLRYLVLTIIVLAVLMSFAVDMSTLIPWREWADQIMANDLVSIIRGGF